MISPSGSFEFGSSSVIQVELAFYRNFLCALANRVAIRLPECMMNANQSKFNRANATPLELYIATGEHLFLDSSNRIHQVTINVRLLRDTTFRMCYNIMAILKD